MALDKPPKPGHLFANSEPRKLAAFPHWLGAVWPGQKNKSCVFRSDQSRGFILQTNHRGSRRPPLFSAATSIKQMSPNCVNKSGGSSGGRDVFPFQNAAKYSNVIGWLCAETPEGKRFNTASPEFCIIGAELYEMMDLRAV